MAALNRRGGKVGKIHDEQSEEQLNPRRVQRPRLIREVLDCGLRGVIVLALLLLLVGSLIYSWSAAPLLHVAHDENPIREVNSVAEASVDISTHDLYDRIQFKNEPGGAWTQGWPVTYRGDEWNHEKLKVFVVPHSHNDPGWIRTAEEYYQERTRHILSTIVQALIQDPRRKFIWEEMSYLQRWWQDASQREKRDFTHLVRNGQLEIVGGGWVMNDEANSHYFAILEQMAAGNMWVHETIGVRPRNAWAIDPFGHSSTMAYLLRRMGFQNMLIQRTHYEVKKVLAREKSLEFMWRQSWDSSNTTDILCHMMPFYSYDIPHTCGPEPAICCQFDYWRLVRVGGAQRCPWGFNPEEIIQNNVKERALLLLDQYRKKSTLYKSNTLLVPLGDDFRYITQQEAELQFKNYQALFDYINEQPELKAKVQFGTLEDYFSTLRAEVVTTKAFPSLSGDFFTYADRVHDYWSGYYVSRPFYKAVDRVLEETLRAANLLFFFTHAGSKSFPSSTHAMSIVKASRNLALFQHHDGVTGTAKDHVVEDYGERMYSSLMELQELMAASVEALLGRQNTGWFRPEESRSKFNVLPVKTPVAGGARRVVFFNPLEEDMEQVVTVMVEDTQVCVVTWNGTSIDSQLTPEWPEGSRHRLQWVAYVPAMGLATYHVKSSSSCKKALLSKLRVFNSKDSFSCPPDYPCTVVESSVENVEISNEHQALVFDTSTGLLKSVHKPPSEHPLKVEEDVAYYVSRGSGAYLFLPNGQARSLVQAGGLMLVTEGPLMQEVYAKFRSKVGKEPVTRSARLFAGNSVQAECMEMVYHVELLDNSYNDMEMVVRFMTELNTGRAFYSDLNGFQSIQRQTYDKIPLQGNYYPMPSLAFMHDATGLRFSVHSRQAVGVASLENGWLEMMLDRRLTQDDGRGLGQGVMDNRPLNVAFHLLLEQSSSPGRGRSAMPSLLSHRVSAQLNYPMHAFIGELEQDDSAVGHKESWSPLVSPLPCDFHVVGLKVLHPEQTSKQHYGILLQRRGWDDSYGTGSGCHIGRVNIRTLFKEMTVGNLRESGLNFVEDKKQVFNVLSRKGKGGGAMQEGVVHLNHMEIQAYKFSVES